MAIAFDAASGLSFGAGTRTFAHTVGSGANRILIVGANVNSNTITLSATYNGVAMTEIANKLNSFNHRSYLWYLVAPNTGSNNIVVTPSSGTPDIGAAGVSYTGAKQTGVPDANGTAEDNASPHRISLTSIADNCWMVAFFGTQNSTTVTAESGTSIRTVTNPGICNLADSNQAITPAGSYTLGMTSTSGWNAAIVAATLEPAPVVVDPNVFDSVTVAEVIAMMVDDDPNVFDSVTITESVSVVPDLAIVVGEDITVTESIQFETIGLSASDDVTITESVQMEMTIEISVSETVTVSESLLFDSPLDVLTASEDISVSESVTVMVELDPSVNDAITVTESGAGAPTLLVAAARDGLIHYRSTEQSQPLMMDEDEIR